jgi:hypothetical protein
MGGEVWGGGVMVTVAATLWVVYLIPTWRRRRQYATAEKNAVRLQQTLRVLAETSEMPEHVRIEAKAREAVDRQRAIRHVGSKKPGDPTTLGATGGRRSVRQLRVASSAVLVLAVAGLGVSAVSPASAGNSVVLVIALAGAVGALVSLKRLARHATPVRIAQRDESPLPDFAFEVVESRERADAPRATWTPTPMPKPLYQSRGTVASSASASASASADAPTQRQRATDTPSVRANAVPGRFAAMGVVRDGGGDGFDLDEVLRRRRAG